VSSAGEGITVLLLLLGVQVSTANNWNEAKFYLIPHGYNNQTWLYNIAVLLNWMAKEGKYPVKYSQPVHKRMNKFQ